MDGDSGAASSSTPITRPAASTHEGNYPSEGEKTHKGARRRRAFTSPSSLDNDD